MKQLPHVSYIANIANPKLQTIFILYLSTILIFLFTSTSFASQFNQPMTFKVYTEHYGNAASTYILAQGVIEADTSVKFDKFYRDLLQREKDDTPYEIWFDSPGGNLSAGLKFGERIRKLRLTTRVGGNYTRTLPGLKEGTVVENGSCYSACAYAFLGGILRIVAADKSYGVHQFRFENSLDSSTSDAQITMTMLGQYLDNMQVNRSVLDLAAITTKDDITFLNIEDAQRLNVDNTQPEIGEWKLEAIPESGKIYGVLKQKLAYTDDEVVILISQADRISDLTISIIYYNNFNRRTSSDIDEIFAMFPQSERRIRLYPGSEYLVATTRDFSIVETMDWKRSQDRLHFLRLWISKKIALEIPQYQYFTVDPDLPHCCMDVARSFVVPTKGLKGIIIAILNKQSQKSKPTAKRRKT